jgi:hypothetical protein
MRNNSFLKIFLSTKFDYAIWLFARILPDSEIYRICGYIKLFHSPPTYTDMNGIKGLS